MLITIGIYLLGLAAIGYSGWYTGQVWFWQQLTGFEPEEYVGPVLLWITGFTLIFTNYLN